MDKRFDVREQFTELVVDSARNVVYSLFAWVPTCMETFPRTKSYKKPPEEMSMTEVSDKTELKKKIQELKGQRGALIESKDHKGLKSVRRQIHGLKRQIKKMPTSAKAAG